MADFRVPPLNIGERLYRVLLHLYPPRFRRAFDRDLIEAFRDQRRDAARRRMPSALFVVAVVVRPADPGARRARVLRVVGAPQALRLRCRGTTHVRTATRAEPRGAALRSASPAARAELHHHHRVRSRARRRRNDGGVQRRERGAAAAPAVSKSRPVGRAHAFDRGVGCAGGGPVRRERALLSGAREGLHGNRRVARPGREPGTGGWPRGRRGARRGG